MHISQKNKVGLALQTQYEEVLNIRGYLKQKVVSNI